MAVKNALLSLSSGVDEKYILQVIKSTKISQKVTRLTLSDGNAYISADTQTNKLSQNIKQYSLVKVQLKYHGLGHPMEIKTLEIVEGDYKFLLGRPVPLVDYVNQGFRSEGSQQNSEEEQEKIAAPQRPQKPKYFRDSQDEKTQIINIEEDNDPVELPLLVQEPFDPYISIDDLQPKINNWKILGRITWIDQKMIQVKCGAKAGQKVLVLNFFLIDRFSKEIKCSCFDEAANKFQHILKRGHVYEFSNGKIFQEPQQSTNRKFLNIRFEVFSTIVEVQHPLHQIPLHSYNLVPFDKLQNYGDDQQLDVGGIVRTILVKEPSPNFSKLKMVLILADPVLQKDIDVGLFLEPEEAIGILQGHPLVLKNVKKSTERLGPISLKSGFNSHYITRFTPNQEFFKRIQPFLSKGIEKSQFQSLSKINYQQRNLSQHWQALQLCSGDQKIYSKVNCYFLGPFGQKKYHYEGCIQCAKKIFPNDRPNYCTKCKKIVEIKDTYLVRSEFADWTKSIKLTLVGDYAKFVLKKQIHEFVKMRIEDQSSYLSSLKFSEVCLYLKSWVDEEKGNLNHNVNIIDKPHFDGLVKIQRILSGVKEQQ